KGYKRGEGQKESAYDIQEYIFGACAGAALYRRKMLEEIGFLDEEFFLIHEDTDLNFRAQLTGWKVLYVPTAVVYHKVRSTIGHMSDTAVYHTLRNSDFVRIKNIPPGIFIRCLPAFLAGMVFEFFYFVIRHGKAGIYCKAKRDVIRNWRSMLARRKKIMAMRKVDNNYLYGLMTPVWNAEFFLSKVRKLFLG
ncbi:MAG TPA: glycosyltransferase family 2 protein, partial [Dissulfurispiraceae bacterium]